MSIRAIREEIPPIFGGLYPLLAGLTPLLLARTGDRPAGRQALLLSVFATSMGGAIFLLDSESLRGPSASVATDTFHDYRIELSIATGAIVVFVDGGRTLTGTAFATARATRPAGRVW